MPKPRTSRTHYTVEHFNEIAAAALEELVDNADPYEVHDLRHWVLELKRTIGQVSDHSDGGDAAALQEAAE
jgi:hypothetical protein